MSDNYHPTILQNDAVHNQLLNSIVGNHDLVCSCDSPLIHITNLIFEFAKPTNFTEKKKTSRKCLGDGDHIGETHGDAAEDGGLSAGDLEKLFAEDNDTG
ncbi:hypothetical protein [Betatorquevirus homini13]|uniref:Hepatitis TT virus Orf2/Gyrovirus Vp2 N-terminal domain-containing protein n=1 Tax=TTV-like mini virus TaxID=93678 RepID=A0A2P1HA19_9VIRU|nr:hypothetical protein QKL38_gp1 [TTV-like mini virus]AVN68372.1 hypothetical protein [TTV-like mini virus]